jgi:RNA polymerase sigma-70 factor (ECF subfamily)
VQAQARINLGPSEQLARPAAPPAVPVGDDDDLLRRARRGDGAALGRLVDRHAPRLYGLAVSLLGRRRAADAEDVVQETLLGALRRVGAFQGRASVRTWLTRILVNQVSKFRRSRRVRVAESLDHADCADARPGPATAAERRLDLMTMLDVLSDDHRQVIVLREQEGMSYQEIASALGVPRGTVESRLFRARQELKARFGEYLK